MEPLQNEVIVRRDLKLISSVFDRAGKLSMDILKFKALLLQIREILKWPLPHPVDRDEETRISQARIELDTSTSQALKILQLNGTVKGIAHASDIDLARSEGKLLALEAILESMKRCLFLTLRNNQLQNYFEELNNISLQHGVFDDINEG